MNGMERPLPVTIAAWIYIVTGVGGFVAHLIEALSGSGFQTDVIEAEFVEPTAAWRDEHFARRRERENLRAAGR